jgi:Trypsin-like peptidase domain
LSSVAVFRDGPLRTGDAIVALGYPLSGLLATGANVSVGNVSALAGLRDDSRYVQISAPIQPGNSGGPLLDASGHLAGIVTSKLNAIRALQVTGDIPQNVILRSKRRLPEHFWTAKVLHTAPLVQISNLQRPMWRRSGNRSPFLLSVFKLIPNPRLYQKRKNRHRKRKIRQCNLRPHRVCRVATRLHAKHHVKHSRNCRTGDGVL